ncbi:MAG: hypothetical protein J5971_01000 [Prevotella sp.]|nr:hypothetical protein [Prevotella sp.]
MITESLVRKQFVHDTLQEGMLRIFGAQAEAARSSLEERTGTLMAYLSAHRFNISQSDTSQVLTAGVLPYLRFLDMQYRRKNSDTVKFKRRSLALYNKVVYGMLYKKVLPELKYGFTDEVRQQVRDQLKQALEG